MGYKENEVNIIMDKLNEDNIKIVLNNDFNGKLIELINHNDFKQNKLNEYLQLLKENSVDSVINLVNNPEESNIDVNLVKEKYYIDENLERYLSYIELNPNYSYSEVVTNVNANIDYRFYTNVVNSDTTKNDLIIVNKYNVLDKDYIPNVVTIANQYSQGVNNKLMPHVKENFELLCEAALLDNIKIYNVSAYRSYNYQKNLYEKYINRDGQVSADTFSARPGHSEHQTGLSLDVVLAGSAFEGTKEQLWMKDNAYLYGFILRYPKGKEHITGYKYEPWHYRYVGLEASKYIYENNITFEEYYAYFVK